MKATPCSKVLLLSRPQGTPQGWRITRLGLKACNISGGSPTSMCVSGYEQGFPSLGLKNEQPLKSPHPHPQANALMMPLRMASPVQPVSVVQLSTSGFKPLLYHC